MVPNGNSSKNYGHKSYEKSTLAERMDKACGKGNHVRDWNTGLEPGTLDIECISDKGLVDKYGYPTVKYLTINRDERRPSK